MTIYSDNKCAEYFIQVWAQEYIEFDSNQSVLNTDLVKSCNEFIKDHFEGLGIKSTNDETFVYITTIRSHLKQYIKKLNLLTAVNFAYNHHNYGKGIKGIRLADAKGREIIILQNIRKQLLHDFKPFIARDQLPAFSFNDFYTNNYYEKLKEKTAEIPKYFFRLFIFHQWKWENIYHKSFNKLKKRCESNWYKKTHRFEKLFPVSYGINATYPRYKIYPTYGTIISLPNELRKDIIDELNKTMNGQFYTLDFTACHLNIIVGLFKDKAPTSYKLLKKNLFWTTLIDEIALECKSIMNPNEYNLLSHKNLKLILKKFVYKKLQGGDIKRTQDIYTSLSKDLQKLLSNHFSDIAKRIQNNICIQEIEKITASIASEKRIYTPEHLDGYMIGVKRQRISRLATGIEVCLLLHLVLIIIELPESMIPISLEHDGILLYGNCSNIQEYVKTINLRISKHSKALIKHPIKLELKD